jgi:hypothetical protein
VFGGSGIPISKEKMRCVCHFKTNMLGFIAPIPQLSTARRLIHHVCAALVYGKVKEWSQSILIEMAGYVSPLKEL